MHEHPEDLNPEAAIHFEFGRPPKTAGKTKRQNAIVAVRHPPPSLSSPGYQHSCGALSRSGGSRLTAVCLPGGADNQPSA